VIAARLAACLPSSPSTKRCQASGIREHHHHAGSGTFAAPPGLCSLPRRGQAGGAGRGHPLASAGRSIIRDLVPPMNTSIWAISSTSTRRRTSPDA